MVTAPPKDILNQIFDPLVDCFTPDVARRIMNVALDPRTQARIDDLAVKANEGTLTEQERAEYEEYIEAMDFLGIVKAKARLALARQSR